MRFKTYTQRLAAEADAEATARLRCASIGKPWPEPPDSYGPGRQPVPPEAYYQKRYVAVAQAGAQWQLPIDTYMEGLQGCAVTITGGSQVQLDFGPGLLGERFGLNSSLSTADVDAAKALGVRWIRLSATIGWGSWHTTQAQYDADQAAGGIWPALQPFAANVAYAHSQGIRVLAIALSSPTWAHGPDRTDGGYTWHQAILPSKRPQFAEYCWQLAMCGADAIEVTNEPNFKNSGYWLGPGHPRAAFPDERVDDYVLLLQAVYRRIKSDPRTAVCQIGIGGVGVYGHELLPDPNAIHGTTWYQRLFAAKADDRITNISAAGFFDFAAHHPYCEFNTQSGPTEWDFRWSQFSANYGDAVYAHGMASVQRVRQTLVAAGCAQAKIWATEVGSPTFGGTCQAKPCVTEAKQSTWLSQYITAWTSNGPTGYTAPLATNFYGDFAGPMFVYQLRDKSDGSIAPNDQEGFFGLQRFSGAEKPAAATLRSAAQGVV